MDRVTDQEMPAAVAKRRRWTVREKREIVEQSMAPGNSIPAVAARHGVSSSQVYRWVRLHRQTASVESGVSALLPVAVAGPNHTHAERMVRGPAGEHSGTIQLEVGSAHLLVHGGADLCSLRVVLDYLLP
jgi:transposase